MTAEEIRSIDVDKASRQNTDTEVSMAVALFLQEIAAQLAELNEQYRRGQ